MAEPFSFSDVKSAILFFMHRECMSGGRVEFSQSTFFDEIKCFPRNYIHIALAQLVKEDLIDRVTVPLTPDPSSGRGQKVAERAWYEIREPGIHLVNNLEPEDKDLIIARLELQAEASSSVVVPASDRVVTLDHNSSDYKEAVSSLEKVIQEFRKDHHLDNELGHEKGALLKALEGGRELLDDTTINLRIGTALIVEPLKRIIEKYDQVLVGALAATALGLIAKLLGLG